jgi:hypothetical protein
MTNMEANNESDGVEALIEAGQLAEAVEAALSIPSAEMRARMLADVAEVYLQAEDNEAALATADLVEQAMRLMETDGTPSAVELLAAVGALRTLAGDPEAGRATLAEAEAITRWTDPGLCRAENWWALARALARSGDEAAAQRCRDAACAEVAREKDPQRRARGMRFLALAHARAGRWEEAWQFARAVTPLEARHELLRELGLVRTENASFRLQGASAVTVLPP